MNRTDGEVKTQGALRTNLPTVLTSFIGRKREIAEVKRLLASSRLVTLTGAAGCGKTRLALRVAAEVSRQYADGVHWVELARLADPLLVAQGVARAVKVVEQPGRPLLDGLLDALQDKQLLLVLDNCEHLLSACIQLVEPLLALPAISVLATSREPLGVMGEMLYPLSPMALPSAGLPVDALAQFDAIQLFVERAHAILPRFELTADNAGTVASICRQLDGIPLAIELASACVSVLSVNQIQERLKLRLELLVSPSRADDRHRTLRAAIDWSYDLLSPIEQLLLQRLTVFASGFILTTAESACAWGGIQHPQVLDLLASLVNKSLVVVETLQANEAHYRLLETIRQYAQEKLQASGARVETYDHYLDCFLRLVEEIAPKLRKQYQQLWLNWLETEHDNLRTALASALEKQRIEAGLRIAVALYQFWDLRGYRQEGLEWFERLLAQSDEGISLAIHASAFTYAAFLANFLGNTSAAIEYGRRAVALSETAGDEGKPILAFALAGMATGMRAAGDYQSVFIIAEQCIQLYRELGDPYHYYLGMSVLVQGEIAMVLGRYDATHALLDEALALARKAGDTYRVALALNYCGDLARCEQNYAQAQTAYEESITLLRNLGAERDVASSLHNLGHTCLHRGDAGRAHALFTASMAIHRDQQNTSGMTECLIGFAALAVARGLPAAGARLLAVLVALDWERGAWEWPATRMEYEHTLALARARLTETEFEAEQAKGHALSIEQAIEYALNLPLPLPLLSQEGAQPSQELTEREREIVAMIALGKSNREIAGELVLSKRTVEKHIANILSKLDFTSRAQIVRWAIENGLTDAGS